MQGRIKVTRFDLYKVYVTQNMLNLNSFILFARQVKTKHSTIMVIVYIFDAFSSVSITLIFTCPYTLLESAKCVLVGTLSESTKCESLYTA